MVDAFVANVIPCRELTPLYTAPYVLNIFISRKAHSAKQVGPYVQLISHPNEKSLKARTFQPSN
jgi:hypothetical protein